MQIGFEGGGFDLRCSFYCEHIQIKDNLLDIHYAISSRGVEKMRWNRPCGFIDPMIRLNRTLSLFLISGGASEEQRLYISDKWLAWSDLCL